MLWVDYKWVELNREMSHVPRIRRQTACALLLCVGFSSRVRGLVLLMGPHSTTCCVDQGGGRWGAVQVHPPQASSVCRNTASGTRRSLTSAPKYHAPASPLHRWASAQGFLLHGDGLLLRITAKTETECTMHWPWTDDDDICYYICVFLMS